MPHCLKKSDEWQGSLAWSVPRGEYASLVENSN